MQESECIRRVALLLIVVSVIMAGILYNFFEVDKVVLQSIGAGIVFLLMVRWVAKGIYEKRKRCVYQVPYDNDKNGIIKRNFDAIGSHLVGNGIFYDGRVEGLFSLELQMYVDKKDFEKSIQILSSLVVKKEATSQNKLLTKN